MADDTMVFALFENREDADAAVDSLTQEHYNPKDISIVMRSEERVEAEEEGSPVAKGAASGAATGAVVGGIAGLLIGIGTLAIPGIGALLIGGPIAAALGLTGAAATTISGAITGALAGGLVGGLVGLGVPREQAEMYEERIRQGAILIAVPVRNGNERLVREVLENRNASDITAVSMRR